MSHVMLTRRLLGVGLRRPPAAPSPACLMASFDKLSLQHYGCASVPWTPFKSPYERYLSSVPPKKDDLNSTMIELPPNLKFDPWAKSSPFYGLERVEPEKKRKKKREQPKKGAPNQIVAGTSVVDVDDKVSYDDKKAIEDVVKGDSEKIVEGDLEAGEDIGDYEDYDSDDEEEEERILYNLSTKQDIPRAIPLPQRLHVPVMDFKTGEQVGTYYLSEKTFGNDPVRVDILHRVVVWQRNKKRGKRNAGARTKTISEVSGSGRKVRKQKGSGRARAGHSRPAHWRGGAKAHGPKGRVQDYTTKLNKKVRKMGVRHALSQKLKEGNLIVTNDLAVPTHKTRDLDIMLQRFGISGKFDGVSALICDDADPGDVEDENSVYGGLNVNFKVASGNLPKVQVMNQKGCHVYGMLKFRKLVLSLAAVRSLEERLERDM